MAVLEALPDFVPRQCRVGASVLTVWSAGEGPPLWLLHGFPDTAASFTEIAGPLLEAGYTLRIPAMPGYPPSEPPPGADYGVPALARLLLQLVAVCDEGPVRIFGHDWGAVIAYAMAALAPERIERLATAAVPHPRRFLQPSLAQLRRSWYMGYFQLPRLPERRIAVAERAFLRRLWRDWSPGWSFSEAQFAPVAAHFASPDAITGALAYYRAMPRTLLQPGARADRRRIFAPLPAPTLVLAGEHDGCIGLDMFCRQETLFAAEYRLAVIADAGHFMHREQASVCAEKLLAWFA